jgi:hypothetical protein
MRLIHRVAAFRRRPLILSNHFKAIAILNEIAAPQVKRAILRTHAWRNGFASTFGAGASGAWQLSRENSIRFA